MSLPAEVLSSGWISFSELTDIKPIQDSTVQNLYHATHKRVRDDHTMQLRRRRAIKDDGDL
ncbi:7351_t:CDS:2 [Paraglomus brasilianum]|uniref:7351_t:CDS:1 n=1 Tax=Paraglomus brasilianum TaxID=144538 RepID=A0A9N9EZ64_9GLOM|nr:7351_t:CDS:2 [Paraglomus brasilianum]